MIYPIYYRYNINFLPKISTRYTYFPEKMYDKMEVDIIDYHKLLEHMDCTHKSAV